MPSIFFKHYVNSFDDSRLKELMRVYGAEGYAAYYYLVEMLYRKGGDPVSEYDARLMAYDLKMEPSRMIEILDYASSEACQEIIQKTKKGYVSKQVTNVVRRNKMIHADKSRAGKIGMQKRWKDKSILEVNR